jgi:hypothetical protein
MEFGRTPGCVRNVLAVLGDGEETMWETFRTAVTLAEAKHARLTLVKTCAAGRAYVWVAPFAVGGAYLSPELDSPEEAGRILAGATERVPKSIPVTTIVLGTDTQESLRNLLQSGNYDAVVAEASLLSHCWRLRRLLRREHLLTITVSRGPGGEDAGNIPAHSTSINVTEDGVRDPEVSEGDGRRSFGMRPRFVRRLAGAGGEQ